MFSTTIDYAQYSEDDAETLKEVIGAAFSSETRNTEHTSVVTYSTNNTLPDTLTTILQLQLNFSEHNKRLVFSKEVQDLFNNFISKLQEELLTFSTSTQKIPPLNNTSGVIVYLTELLTENGADPDSIKAVFKTKSEPSSPASPRRLLQDIFQDQRYDLLDVIANMIAISNKNLAITRTLDTIFGSKTNAITFYEANHVPSAASSPPMSPTRKL